MSQQTLKLRNRQHIMTLKIKRALSQLPCIDFLTSQSKPQYTDNIQNGLYVQLVHERLKLFTNIFSILLCINIVMLYIYYQLDFDNNPYAFWCLMLTYFVHLACSIIYGMLFAIQYENVSKANKSDYNYTFTILKLLVYFLIHPLPWINHTTMDITYDDISYNNLEMPFKVNYMLVIVCMLKNIIMFFITSLINSSYIGPRASRIKKIYSVHAKDSIYALRCIFRDVPIKMFSAFFMVSLLYFSLSIQITESNVPVSNNPFIYYENCLWYVIITATTVGFGQLHIFTHFGYICNIFCMVWGSLYVSCILVILINTLTLNSKEQASLTTLKRVEIHLEYHKICKMYIRTSLWRLWKNYKKNLDIHQPIQERKMRKQLGLLRRQTNITQFSQRQFDNALINISYLHQNNTQLLNFIGNHIFSEKLYREYGNNDPETQSYILEEESEEDALAMALLKKESQGKLNGSSKHIKIKLFKAPSENISEVSEYSSINRLQ